LACQVANGVREFYFGANSIAHTVSHHAHTFASSPTASTFNPRCASVEPPHPTTTTTTTTSGGRSKPELEFKTMRLQSSLARTVLLVVLADILVVGLVLLVIHRPCSDTTNSVQFERAHGVSDAVPRTTTALPNVDVRLQQRIVAPPPPQKQQQSQQQSQHHEAEVRSTPKPQQVHSAAAVLQAQEQPGLQQVSASTPKTHAALPLVYPPIAPELTSLFVIGMHRSSTSIVTRTLSEQLNFRLGSLEVTADHHESMFLCAQSDRLLSLRHSTWDNIHYLARENSIDWGNQCDTTVRHALHSMLHARPTYGTSSHNPSGPLVVKEPRMCLTLPYYLTCLPAPPHILLIFRNPLEVAQSLNTRDNMTLPRALGLWYQYNKFALAHTRNLHRTFVNARELTSSTPRVLEHLYHVFTDMWNMPLISQPSQSSIQIAVESVYVNSRQPESLDAIRRRVEMLLHPSVMLHEPASDMLVGAADVMAMYEYLEKRNLQVESPGGVKVPLQ
jgi:hypothetical protein